MLTPTKVWRRPRVSMAGRNGSVQCGSGFGGTDGFVRDIELRLLQFGSFKVDLPIVKLGRDFEECFFQWKCPRVHGVLLNASFAECCRLRLNRSKHESEPGQYVGEHRCKSAKGSDHRSKAAWSFLQNARYRWSAEQNELASITSYLLRRVLSGA